jgi:DNA modification methylase
MKEMQDNSISCILTDPPYGLSFMNKSWDHGIPQIEYWQEMLRICKPGAFLMAFGGTRTFHRLTCLIEDAGWEIRDCLSWLYGSGFPKSLDVSKAIDKSKGEEREVVGIKPGHENFIDNPKFQHQKGIEREWYKDPEKVKRYHSQTKASSDLAKQFDGYGTALKPAWEPIILAMKPCDGTFAQNVEKWGQAGLNIDECRIETKEKWTRNNHTDGGYQRGFKPLSLENNSKGRWPANLILDEEAGVLLDEQSGIEASRFFYCAKASPSERNRGCEELPVKEDVEHAHGRYRCKNCKKLKLDHNPCNCENPDFERTQVNKNFHPTVKPQKLLQYLLKLIMPPKDGVILDPFAGSGSTLVAAQELGFNAIGIELEKDYCEIARKRCGL